MEYFFIKDLISDKISGEWGTDPVSDKCVKVIRTTNFTNEGRISFSNVVEREISESKIRQKHLKDGDIIIEKSGGSPTQPVGRVVFFDVSDDKTYLCNNFTSVLRPSEKVFPKYLFYNLYYLHLKNKTLNYQNKTTGIINLQLDRYIKTEKIPLPLFDDQKHIVKIIDKADALQQIRKKSIELLDNYLKSVFLEMFGDPVRNTKRWPKQKFEKLGTLDRGKSKHRPRNAPELLGGKHPLIQTGDVANADLFIEKYSSTYSDLGLKQSKKWPKGTLCITIAANIAKTGILNFDACFPDSVVGFVADTDKTSSIFIHFWMSFFQKILESNAPESAQKNINLRILRGMDVINPPIELQNKFSEIVGKSETIKQKMLVQSEELENQFQSLMQKVFKGEI